MQYKSSGKSLKQEDTDCISSLIVEEGGLSDDVLPWLPGMEPFNDSPGSPVT